METINKLSQKETNNSRITDINTLKIYSNRTQNTYVCKKKKRSYFQFSYNINSLFRNLNMLGKPVL